MYIFSEIYTSFRNVRIFMRNFCIYYAYFPGKLVHFFENPHFFSQLLFFSYTYFDKIMRIFIRIFGAITRIYTFIILKTCHPELHHTFLEIISMTLATKINTCRLGEIFLLFGVVIDNFK